MQRFFILIILIGELALGATSTTVLKKDKTISTKKLLPKNFTVGTSLGVAGSVSAKSESEGYRTATFSLTPSYKINEDFTVLASASVTQEYEIEKVTYSNTTVTLSLPTVKLLNDNVTMSSRVSGALPTNYKAYRDETFRGNLSLGSTLSSEIGSTYFPVNVSYGFSGGRNLHKFRRNNFRRSNTEYFLTHSLSLSKAVSKFTIALNGSLNPVWDYTGEYEPTFSLSQSVSYASSAGVRYSLSHSTSDRALDYRGDFSNVRLLDDYGSRINFNLAYTIK